MRTGNGVTRERNERFTAAERSEGAAFFAHVFARAGRSAIPSGKRWSPDRGGGGRRLRQTGVDHAPPVSSRTIPSPNPFKNRPGIVDTSVRWVSANSQMADDRSATRVAGPEIRGALATDASYVRATPQDPPPCGARSRFSSFALSIGRSDGRSSPGYGRSRRSDAGVRFDRRLRP